MKTIVIALGVCWSLTGGTGAQTLPAVADLPLTEVAAGGSDGVALAFVLSGDGGWAGLVRTVAGAIAGEGIPVVGMSSLRYFWSQRSPEESALALEAVLRHYLAQWHRERIILIGYSRGADILPFMISRLPADLRRRIDAVALLGPATMTSFEVHIPAWLYSKSVDDIATQPEIEKILDLAILCVYGDDETDSVCPQLPKDIVKLDKRTGGHHFDGDYQPIAEKILEHAGY